MKFNKFNLSEDILKSLKDLDYINATKVQERLKLELEKQLLLLFLYVKE